MFCKVTWSPTNRFWGDGLQLSGFSALRIQPDSSTPVHSRKRLSFAEAGGFHLLPESGRIFSINCRPIMTALHLLKCVCCPVIKLKCRYWTNCSPVIKMTALWFLNWVMELYTKSVSCSVFIPQVSVAADRPAQRSVCTILCLAVFVELRLVTDI